MNRKQLMVLALMFLLILPLTTQSAFGWDKIIAFGDSLSDNGPEDGFGFGVSSNGPVWLDYLAASMVGVELEDRALGGALTHGNYAAGSADLYGLDWQVDMYLAQLGAPPTGETKHNLSGTLFTVWIGGNDFLNLGPSDDTINYALNNIEDSLQKLIDAGAEDILVMSLPDLGIAPGVVYGGLPTGLFTQKSQAFNTNLTTLVCSLDDVNEDVKFYMADTFGLLQYAVANAEDLGFTNADFTCEWAGAGPSCTGFVFWDGIHPTTATHKYLAALALGQVKHGRVDKEMKGLLKDLKPIQPRKPYVVNCFE